MRQLNKAWDKGDLNTVKGILESQGWAIPAMTLSRSDVALFGSPHQNQDRPRDTIDSLTPLRQLRICYKVQNCYGETLLHIACKYGTRGFIRYLLGRDRINTSMLDRRGNTLVHCACYNRNCGALRILIESRRMDVAAVINSQNLDGDTPLHVACRYDNRNNAEYLIQTNEIGVEVNANIRNSAGDTPLHCSYRHQRREINEVLLGCDRIDVSPEAIGPNQDGDSVLHLICKWWYPSTDAIVHLKDSGRFDVNTMLRDNGAKQNSDGDTPFHVLLRRWLGKADDENFSAIGHPQECFCTSNHSHDGTRQQRPGPFSPCTCGSPRQVFSTMVELYQIATTNSAEATDVGSSCKLDDIFKIQNNDGNTLLHLVCLRGEQRMMQDLIRSRIADVSFYLKNKEGDTPFHIAFSKSVFLKIDHAVRLAQSTNVIQHEVVSTTNLSDLSQPSSDAESMKIIQRLMDQAKPIAHIQNRHGDTLLHLACKNGDVGDLRHLIACDSLDATLRNDNGDTPLHCICNNVERGNDYDNLKKFEVLIEARNVKADVNATNSQGNTVLHCVVQNGWWRMEQYLRRLGSLDPHVRNDVGAIASCLAPEKKRRKRVLI